MPAGQVQLITCGLGGLAVEIAAYFLLTRPPSLSGAFSSARAARVVLARARGRRGGIDAPRTGRYWRLLVAHAAAIVLLAANLRALHKIIEAHLGAPVPVRVRFGGVTITTV